MLKSDESRERPQEIAEFFAGWTFRSGMIDPEKFPRLLLEFEASVGNVERHASPTSQRCAICTEVMQAAISSATRIGLIQIPVTEECVNPVKRDRRNCNIN